MKESDMVKLVREEYRAVVSKIDWQLNGSISILDRTMGKISTMVEWCRDRYGSASFNLVIERLEDEERREAEEAIEEVLRD